MQIISLQTHPIAKYSFQLRIFAYMKQFLTLVILLISSLSFAQIVNIESKRSNKIDSINWNGTANLSFNLVNNGKEVITIKSNLRIEHLRGPHLFLSISDFSFGQIDKEGFQNQGFQHFRYNYELRELFVWEAFTQIQYNERIKLKMRYLAGTGPRFGLIHKEPYYVYSGIMYMYEYNEEVYGDPEESYLYRDHRLSTYLALSLKPTKQVSIYNTSYYQPLLNNFEDLRLSSVTSINILVTKRLSFTNTFNITYDSRVPETVPKTIYSFLTGLKLKF